MNGKTERYQNDSNEGSYSRTFHPIGGPSKLFDKIRFSHLHKQTLYTDSSFPPDETSLYYSRKSPCNIVWMRPTEIVAANSGSHVLGMGPRRMEYPVFIADGGVQFGELRQGELGDCWVVAALASISTNPQLLNRTVCVGQSFRADWYAGIFSFRFWRFGTWQEVIIDDWLPVRPGGKPLFVHSGRQNEFWPALLEKAYAKLNGSYEALNSALIGDAMDDICGGLTESYFLRLSESEEQGSKLPPDLDDVLIKSFDHHSLITARIRTNGTPGPGFVLPVGYVPGQAFALTDCRKLRLTDHHGIRLVRLVRIRNLWPIAYIGWVGSWSEASAEWLSLSPEDRVKVGLVRQEGEFWISLDDFKANFDYLDICHICESPPGDKFNEDLGLQIPRFLLRDRWYRGVNAGGRPYNKASHWANPQFHLKVSTPDQNDTENLATVVIALMQTDERSLRHRSPRLASIGFVLYKLPNGSIPPMGREFFDCTSYFASVDFFFDSREVVKRFRVPPGNYLFVPCTYTPDHPGEFIIRALFEQDDRSFVPTRHTVELRGFAVTGPDMDDDYEVLQSRVRRLFYESSGELMAVDAFQLETIICSVLSDDYRAPYKFLDLDACRALVMLMDRSESARITELDFRKMWNILRAWTKFFASLDPQRLQFVTSLDFRIILENSARIMRRYANADWRISYSHFVEAMALVTKTIAIFSQYDQENVGAVNLTLEKFLGLSLMM